MSRRIARKISREWGRWQLGERGRPGYDRPQLQMAVSRSCGGRRGHIRAGRWPFCREFMPVGSAYVVRR